MPVAEYDWRILAPLLVEDCSGGELPVALLIVPRPGVAVWVVLCSVLRGEDTKIVFSRLELLASVGTLCISTCFKQRPTRENGGNVFAVFAPILGLCIERRGLWIRSPADEARELF